MALKFASNLSFMFTEAPSIIDRYQLAKQAGFKAVESGFPFGFSVQQVATARKKADVEQILLNVFTGIFCIYVFARYIIKIILLVLFNSNVSQQVMLQKENWVLLQFQAKRKTSRKVLRKR